MTGMTRALAPLAAAAVLLAAAGCAGQSGSSSDGKTPEQVMAAAKQKLDHTSGVDVSLKASADPGTDYLKSASGTIVAKPPAFEGTAAGSVSGLPVSGVPVVSVGGTLWINHPLLGGWSDKYQPKDLCAPDPATLLDPDSGISELLASAKGLTKGDAHRDTTDASVVVTPYSGTVDTADMRKILPCANGNAFKVTFDVGSDGALRSAELTGAFFPRSHPITYTIDITQYDVTKDIKAPK